jgi:hypothetical protein
LHELFCYFHHFTTTIPVVCVVDVAVARLTKKQIKLSIKFISDSQQTYLMVVEGIDYRMQTGTHTSIISPLSGMKVPLASKLVMFSGSMVNFHAVVMMTELFTILD